MQMRMRSVHAKAVLMACLALGSGASDAAAADPYAVIYRFGQGDGNRTTGIAADTNGDLYGANFEGGPQGCGTIFRLTKPAPNGTVWTYQVLHGVHDHGGLDNPECHPTGAPVVHDYFIDGTTGGDGRTTYGSVYRLFKGGTHRVLHTFDKTHGSYPNGLLLGGDGKLFGATSFGGPFDCPGTNDGQGVLYQTGPAGGFRTLHNFGNGNGSYPNQVVFGADGAIYGTTRQRCTPTKAGGNGVAFRITTDRVYSILHSFDDAPGASVPYGPLAVAPNGTLFGATQRDGTISGTVYSLKPGAAGQPWTFTVLHQFSKSDGRLPQGLVRDNVGNLYGTTKDYLGARKATLFRLSPPTTGSAWTFTTLHIFDYANSADGFHPNGELILKDGVLYGTTTNGGNGANGTGTVFSYTLH